MYIGYENGAKEWKTCFHFNIIDWNDLEWCVEKIAPQIKKIVAITSRHVWVAPTLVLWGTYRACEWVRQAKKVVPDGNYRRPFTRFAAWAWWLLSLRWRNKTVEWARRVLKKIERKRIVNLRLGSARETLIVWMTFSAETAPFLLKVEREEESSSSSMFVRFHYD